MIRISLEEPIPEHRLTRDEWLVYLGYASIDQFRMIARLPPYGPRVADLLLPEVPEPAPLPLTSREGCAPLTDIQKFVYCGYDERIRARQQLAGRK